jgi:ribonuclease HI
MLLPIDNETELDSEWEDVKRNFKEIHVYFESGCIFNSSKGFFALSIESTSGRIVSSFGKIIKKCTKDEARYHALVKGLALASARTSGRVKVFTDNELLINQMGGSCRVTGPNLIRLYCEARILEEKFEVVIYENLKEGARLVEAVVINKIASKQF